MSGGTERLRRQAQHLIDMLNQMDAAGFVGCFEQRAEMRKWAEAALADSPAPSTRDAVLEEAAGVADQYYRQLSNNGVTFEIYGVASDIRDDIRALKGSAAPALSQRPSRSKILETLNACGSTMRANDPGEVANKLARLFEWHTPAPSSEAGARWTPEGLAKRFHQLYEYLAPKFGYETRKESAVEWEKVPERNRELMTTVCEHILKELELERTLAEMPPTDVEQFLANQREMTPNEQSALRRVYHKLYKKVAEMPPAGQPK